MELIHVYSRTAEQKWHEKCVPRCLPPCLFLFNSPIGLMRRLASGVLLKPKLLRECLMQIHKDVVTSWDFKDEVTY